MRWFKHMTDTWTDEKISMVVHEHGMAGYGFWWRLLEIVAKNMDANTQPEATYTAKKWGQLCGCYPKVFRKFCETFAKHFIIDYQLDGDLIYIKIPNLLKYRDETTTKKQRESVEFRSKNQSQNIDIEYKKDTNKLVSKENEGQDDLIDEKILVSTKNKTCSASQNELQPILPLDDTAETEGRDHAKQQRSKLDTIAKRATRIPPDWRPSDGDDSWIWSKFGRRPDEGDVSDEAEKFRNYWIAKPGQGGVKLDWSATWRNWIMSSAIGDSSKNRSYGSTPRQNGQRTGGIVDSAKRAIAMLQNGDNRCN